MKHKGMKDNFKCFASSSHAILIGTSWVPSLAGWIMFFVTTVRESIESYVASNGIYPQTEVEQLEWWGGLVAVIVFRFVKQGNVTHSTYDREPRQVKKKKEPLPAVKAMEPDA